MEEENRNEDSGVRIPLLQLDSAWAWFYYLIFGVQLLVVSYYHAERELRIVVSDSPLETYIAILKGVSSQVPAIAAYSLVIAVTAEGLRMIAERYLARRFAEGKKQGIAEGVKQASAEYDERLARWLDANPAIKDAIESGEVNPPPFLNGDYTN